MLCNLGTLAAPTVGAVRSFLVQFLSDSRVVELPRAVWWPILYGLVLPFSPLPRRLNTTVWDQGGAVGSPLLLWTRQQTDCLRQTLAVTGMGGVKTGLPCAMASTATQRHVSELRFGKAKWVEPCTEPTVEALARSGTRSLDVICPGFSSDCIETLEEINMEVRHAFTAAGGRITALSPA